MDKKSKIQNRRTYLDKFSGPPSDREIRAESLKYAIEIRKFEIELYWKRATYFWTLIAASFAAYFVLQSVKSAAKDPSSIFLVTCLGFILSLGWYLVNRGSKYWQENWERHVDVLEDEIIGPLYRTNLSRQECSIFKPHDSFPFSVSRINQMISLFVTVIWLALGVYSFPFFSLADKHLFSAYCGLGVLTLTFAILLIWLSWPKKCPRKRRINFEIDELENTD
ncbi:MAG: hypothetical protein SVW57_10375 [Thermodesulfobacteriota bacterium]|nr:hypothetical protein [Thermodesulfobacteriota bacterium]